jgi:hypothetical protein
LKSKSVAIIVGFTEGDWHRRQLQLALEKRGYRTTSDLASADVIFAHSGGCYNVPLNLRHQQLVMLVNPTYWPGRTLHKRAQIMSLHLIYAIRPGHHPRYHAWKTLHNIGYLFWHGSQNLSMVRRAPKYNLEAELKHVRTILVRNQTDPWLTPDFRDLQHTNPHLKTVELPGDHDDCWLHPDTYVDLLESELKEN